MAAIRGSFAGRIPVYTKFAPFRASLREAEDELGSTLEDWIVVGLKLGHELPVVAGIDLKRPTHEQMDAE